MTVTDGTVADLGIQGSEGSFSPDARYVAYVVDQDGQQDLFVHDLEKGQSSRITQRPEPDRHPIWSANGDYLVFSSRRLGDWDLWAVQVAEGEALGAPFLLKQGISRCPKGRTSGGDLILYHDRLLLHPSFVRIAPDSAKARAATPFRGMSYEQGDGFLDWSPDGTRFAYVRHELPSNRRRLCVRSLSDDAEVVYDLPVLFRSAWWHRDGRTLALFRQGFGLLDLDTKNYREVVPAFTEHFEVPDFNFVQPVGWFDDGRSFLFRIAPLQLEADDEQFPYYVILELESGESRRMNIPEDVGLQDYYVPSADQALFISVPRGGQKLVIRDASGAVKATLVDLGEPGEQRIHNPSWSPDGSMVAYHVTGQNPELRVIKAPVSLLKTL